MRKAISKELECPICFKILRDAKFLKCMHFFCRGCIETLLRNEYRQLGMPHSRGLDIECPMCRQRSFFQKCSTSDLVPNTLANNMVKTIQAERAVEGEKRQRRRRIGGISPKPQASLIVNCSKCRVLVDCSKPEFLEHFDHVSVMTPVEHASKRINTQINVLLERSFPWLEEHQGYQQRLEKMKRQGMRYFDNLEADVNRAFDAQSTKLRDAKEKLQSEIAARKTSFSSKFEKLLEQDRYWTTTVAVAQDEGKRYLFESSSEKTLRVFETWQAEMKKALSVDVPSPDGTRHEANTAMLLHFEKSPKSVELGTIKEISGLKYIHISCPEQQTLHNKYSIYF